MQGPYKILYDITSAGDVETLENALNIMAGQGWRPICLASRQAPPGLGIVHVILEKKDALR